MTGASTIQVFGPLLLNLPLVGGGGILDGSVLMALVFEGLYSPTDIRVLPRMIEEIENETYRTVSRLASRVFAQREALSVGMHVSVQCHEEVPFTTTAERAAAIEPYPELDAFFEPLSLESPELCELWPAGFGGDLENQPVTSDLPALVLAGQFDPITPPAWGRSAAETLPNSIFYEFPSIGHSAVFTDDCPNSLAREFLRDPTTAPDSPCIADIAPIAFTP